jgi:hypothetical protein
VRNSRLFKFSFLVQVEIAVLIEYDSHPTRPRTKSKIYAQHVIPFVLSAETVAVLVRVRQ